MHDVLPGLAPTPRFIEDCKDGDPAIHVTVACDEVLHRALAVAGSPVPQQANAAASGRAFRDFITGVFPAGRMEGGGWFEAPSRGAPVGNADEARSASFNALTNEEADTAQAGLSTAALAGWFHACVVACRGSRLGVLCCTDLCRGGALPLTGKCTRRDLSMARGDAAHCPGHNLLVAARVAGPWGGPAVMIFGVQVSARCPHTNNSAYSDSRLSAELCKTVWTLECPPKNKPSQLGEQNCSSHSHSPSPQQRTLYSALWKHC